VPGGVCILGSAGTTNLFSNFTGAPLLNTWYYAALANKLHGSDLDPAKDEITASFNNGYLNWYLGTDGHPAANQVDFVSVVLHEMGHGLGFLGTMKYASGTGSYGVTGFTYPSIFDRFMVNGSGQSLVDTTLFTNPSIALGSQMVSNNIYFDSPTVREINSGNKAKLYAPGAWAQGSSLLHLDETTYNGTPNALMTYSIGTGEVQHNPGPIVLAIFKDMGWTVALTPNTPTLLTATTFSGSQINLTWNDSSSYETSYRVERSLDNTNWATAATLPANTTSYSDTGLILNTLYYYRVVASNMGVDSLSSNVLSATTHPLTPNTPTLLTTTTFSSTQINLTWNDNSTYETSYRVESSLDNTNWGTIVTLPANTTSYSDTGLIPSTLYYYRVVASNMGVDSLSSNVLSATTLAATIWTVKIVDDGGDSVDAGNADTLSYAISHALNGQEIKFQLNGGGTIVNVSGKLRAVTAGVVIDGGSCGGSGITIKAKPLTPAATLSSIDGLVLGGATIRNITVSGFGGRQIVANTGRDKLFCSKASKASN
jgi:hypothetical protein